MEHQYDEGGISKIPMSPTLTELAYFAGIMDGEGHVSVQRARFYNRHGVLCVGYRVFTSVCNKNKALIDWMHGMFGGYLRRDKTKQLYYVVWTGPKAIPILKSVLPWLIVKKHLALLCMEFEHMRVSDFTEKGIGIRHSVKYWEEASEFADRSHELIAGQYEWDEASCRVEEQGGKEMSDRFTDRGKNAGQGVKQSSTQTQIKGPNFTPGEKPHSGRSSNAKK